MPKPLSHKDEILAIYERHGGGLSMKRLAALCWEEGVWNEDERRHMAWGSVTRACRDALSSRNKEGLPFAGPSPRMQGRSHVWVQLDFWDEETSLYNIALRLRQETKDHEMTERLCANHEKRWGKAPLVPQLTFPEDQPHWWLDSLYDGEQLEDTDESNGDDEENE